MPKIKRLYAGKPVGADGSSAEIIYPVTTADAILYSNTPRPVPSGGGGGGTAPTVQEEIQGIKRTIGWMSDEIDDIETKISKETYFATDEGDLPYIEVEEESPYGTNLIFPDGCSIILNELVRNIPSGYIVDLFPTYVGEEEETVEPGTPYYLIFDSGTTAQYTPIKSIPAIIMVGTQPTMPELTNTEYIIGISSRTHSGSFTYGKYIFDLDAQQGPQFDPYTITRKFTNNIAFDACIKEIWFNPDIDFMQTADTFSLWLLQNTQNNYTIGFYAIDSEGVYPTVSFGNDLVNKDTAVIPLYRETTVAMVTTVTLVGYCVIDWLLVTENIVEYTPANSLTLLVDTFSLRECPIISNYLLASGYKEWTDNKAFNQYIKEFYITELFSPGSTISVTIFKYDSLQDKCTVTIESLHSGTTTTYTDSNVPVGSVYKFASYDIWIFVDSSFEDSKFEIDGPNLSNEAFIDTDMTSNPLNSPVCYTKSLV